MLEWILSLLIAKIIGQKLFIGIVLAVSAGATAWFTFLGHRALATLTFAAGGLLSAFLFGIAASSDVYEAKIQAFKDELQAAEDTERQRQAAVNELRRKLAETNSLLTAEMADERKEVIREIRTKVIRNGSGRWTADEFDRLQRITQPRRKRSGG